MKQNVSYVLDIYLKEPFLGGYRVTDLEVVGIYTGCGISRYPSHMDGQVKYA